MDAVGGSAVELPGAVLAGFAFVLGLIFGSFATAVAYRVPRKASLGGRSHCPSCGATITAAENIPVVSFLLQRGRCRHCGAPISARYPAIELTTAVLFALSALRFGLSFRAVVFAGFFWALVVLSVIDLEHKLLPNRIVYPLLVVGGAALSVDALARGQTGAFGTAVVTGALLVIAVLLTMLWPSGETPVEDEEDDLAMQPVPSSPRERLLYLGGGIVALVLWMATLGLAALDGPYRGLSGAIVGASLFSGLLFALSLLTLGLLDKVGMAGGDVKLALPLGLFAGFIEAPAIVVTAIFFAFLAGGLPSIAMVARGRRGAKIPFGPFLALGTVIAVLVGRRVLDAYLGTFS